MSLGLSPGFFFGGYMRRSSVNKRRSAKRFRRDVGRTKYANVRPGLARGGYRL